jgi:hypothetical protein
MRRARMLLAPFLIALAMVVITPMRADADNSAAAQCTKNANDHFGIVAPWDGACWKGAFDNIAHFAGDSVATTVTRWVMSGAVETTGLFLNEFGSGTSTRPSFGSPWFQQVYYGNVPHQGGTFPGQPGALAIAGLLAVPLVVMTIIAGVVRGDIGSTLKTVLVRLPLIVVLCFTFIAVLQRGFAVIDALSGWVVGGTVADFQTWTSKFDPSNVGADFAVVIICIVIIVTTLIAYIELFVRSAMIYLVVAFVPIISVATLWQGSRTALKKTVEFLVVMTCSKLVMAFAFMVGAGALTAGDAQSFAPLLVGAVIFAVIAFAPFALFALIPIAEAAAVGAVAGMGARFGGRMLRRGVGYGKSAVGGAPGRVSGAATAVGHAPGQARSALDAGARRMQPLGNGLRGLGGGALAIAGGKRAQGAAPATGNDPTPAGSSTPASSVGSSAPAVSPRTGAAPGNDAESGGE